MFSGVSAFEESEIVVEAYKRFKFGARMLKTVIRRLYEKCISHNRIHRYLVDRELARTEVAKKKQRKWVRFERDHIAYRPDISIGMKTASAD